MRYKLAVIGNPIEHSLSPTIFNMFAQNAGIDLQYDKILALDNVDFKLKAVDFFRHGGSLLNVTSPFKGEAFLLANSAYCRATYMQVANVLFATHACMKSHGNTSAKSNSELQIVANSVDGLGLINDIKYNLNYDLAGKNVVILGSGMVVEAIIPDLIASNIKKLSVVARNAQRLHHLRNKFAIHASFNAMCLNAASGTNNCTHSRLDSDISGDTHVLINTIPFSCDAKEFMLCNIPSLVQNGALFYDLNYQAPTTPFLQFMHEQTSLTAKSHLYANGLGMLVEQAAIAFNDYFAIMPDSKRALKQLLLFS